MLSSAATERWLAVVQNRPLPDLRDPDVQMEVLLANEYTEIVQGLFLGGDYNPQKVVYLNGTVRYTVPKFGFVVRCSENPSKCAETVEVPLFAFEPRADSEGRVCVGVHCFDLHVENDLLMLIDCCNKIKANLEKQHNVLVHCQQGVDRSATVVAAFCMACFAISTTQARESLKRLRPACTEQVPVYEDYLRKNEDRIQRFFVEVLSTASQRTAENEGVSDVANQIQGMEQQRIYHQRIADEKGQDNRALELQMEHLADRLQALEANRSQTHALSTQGRAETEALAEVNAKIRSLEQDMRCQQKMLKEKEQENMALRFVVEENQSHIQALQAKVKEFEPLETRVKELENHNQIITEEIKILKEHISQASDYKESQRRPQEERRRQGEHEAGCRRQEELLQQEKDQRRHAEFLQQDKEERRQTEFLQQATERRRREEFLQQENDRRRQDELLQQEKERRRQEELFRQEQERRRQEVLLQQAKEQQRQEELLQQEQEQRRQTELLQQERERRRQEDLQERAGPRDMLRRRRLEEHRQDETHRSNEHRPSSAPMRRPHSIANKMEITCPDDALPGGMIMFRTSSGQRYQIEVPPGIYPGMTFVVTLPS